MIDAMLYFAGYTLEFPAGRIVDLPRLAASGEAPSEVGNRPEGGASDKSIVPTKIADGGIAPDVVELQELGAFGAFQSIPR